MKKLIRNIEEGMDYLGLTINKNKSKIMIITKRKTKAKNKLLLGYEYTDKYKYLGSVWDETLNPVYHINEIKKKVQFLQCKMTPIRMKMDMKTNKTLFKVFILPLFRILSSCFNFYNEKQREYITK